MANPTTVRQFMISTLIFTAIVTGAFTMIAANLPDSGGNFSDYNGSFNKFDEIKSQSETMSDTMENADPSSGTEGILTGLWDISFGAVKQVWNSISIIAELIKGLSRGGTPLDLPTWVTNLWISIILITITFAIIASIRKWYI